MFEFSLSLLNGVKYGKIGILPGAVEIRQSAGVMVHIWKSIQILKVVVLPLKNVAFMEMSYYCEKMSQATFKTETTFSSLFYYLTE